MSSASTACHSKSREVASCLVTPLNEALYSFTRSSYVYLHQYSCCCKRDNLWLHQGTRHPLCCCRLPHRKNRVRCYRLHQPERNSERNDSALPPPAVRVPFISLYKIVSGLILHLIHYIAGNNTPEVFQGSRTLSEIEASFADTGTNPILPAKNKTFCSSIQQDSWECSPAPWGTRACISTHIITRFVLSLLHSRALICVVCYQSAL